MPRPKKPSEFGKRGPRPFGGYGLAYAWEKLRFIRRTEQSTDEAADLDAKPDKYLDGGVTPDNWRNIRGG